MAGLAKLKAEHKSTFVAFGGGGRKLLGDRDDLDKLALIAQESGDKSLLDLFEQPLPTVAQLKKAKVDAELKKGPENKVIPIADQEHELLNENKSPDPNAENKNQHPARKGDRGNSNVKPK